MTLKIGINTLPSPKVFKEEMGLANFLLLYDEVCKTYLCLPKSESSKPDPFEVYLESWISEAEQYVPTIRS